MSIRFTCANSDCGREVAAPDGAVGKKSRCPYCGKVQIVPAVEAAGPSPFSGEGAPAGPAAARPSSARGGPVQACPVCGTVFPAGQTCPQCRRHKKSYAREHRDVARAVKIGVLLAAVVGVVVGIVWAIRAYAPGEGKPRTPSYFDGVFGAKHMAESVVSMAGNLQAIRDAMDRYVSAFGSYPPDLQELVGNGMLPASALRAPDSAKQAYAYIPGQKQSMSGDNILVYEEKPIHRDTCNVLRLGGRIEQLTVEQLNQALEQTRQRIGQ